MSGVPVICSCLRLEFTVLRPSMPITRVAMPKATRMTAAAYPPNSNTFLFVISGASLRIGLPGFKRHAVETASAPGHRVRAVYYGTAAVLGTDRDCRTATGSNRAWKKRRFSGS